MKRGRPSPSPPKQGPLVLLSAVAVAIAVLLLLLVIFQAIDTFKTHDHAVHPLPCPNSSFPEGGCVEEIITSNTSGLIQVQVVDLDEICNPFEIDTWRLHRTCGTVHFGFHGICRNARDSDGGFQLDLSMVNFPSSVGTPSPNLERYDVSGVGSVNVDRPGVGGILEVDGDTGDPHEIDVDIRLNSDFQEQDDIEIALLCMYQVFEG
jgi:hypothetical protein